MEVHDPLYFQETERSFGARGAYLTSSYNFRQQPRVRQQRPEGMQETQPEQIVP